MSPSLARFSARHVGKRIVPAQLRTPWPLSISRRPLSSPGTKDVRFEWRRWFVEDGRCTDFVGGGRGSRLGPAARSLPRTGGDGGAGSDSHRTGPGRIPAALADALPLPAGRVRP